MDMKVCTNNKCEYKGQLQSLDRFHKQGKNRHNSQCKSCISKHKKKINKFKRLSKLGNMKKRKSFLEVEDICLKEIPGYSLNISNELVNCVSELVSDLVERKLK